MANCVWVHDVAAAGEFHRDIQARASCRSFGLHGQSHNAFQAKNVAACRVLEKPSERSFAVDAQIALSSSQSKFGARSFTRSSQHDRPGAGNAKQ